MPSIPGLAATVALAAGAACIAVALWMLLRRSGRPAVAPLALVAGALLVALPRVLPAPVPPAPAPAAAEAPVTVAPIAISPDGRRTVAAAVREPTLPPPPPLPGRTATRIDIEATEQEPNGSLAAANVARLGTAITGTLGEGDLDFFSFETPPGLRGEVVAALTVLEGNAGLTLYDETGEPIGNMDTPEQISVRTTTLTRMIDSPSYYLLVRANPDRPGSARYHLTVAARRR